MHVNDLLRGSGHFHLVRYHGILGPCASERDRVVPGSAAAEERVRPPRHKPVVDSPSEAPNTRAGQGREQGPTPGRTLGEESIGASSGRAGGPQEPRSAPDEPALRPRRLAWAELLRRVFAVDVLECPRCGGRMRLLAVIQPPDVAQAILDCLDLSSRAPPTAAAAPDSENAEGWPENFDVTL